MPLLLTYLQVRYDIKEEKKTFQMYRMSWVNSNRVDASIKVYKHVFLYSVNVSRMIFAIPYCQSITCFCFLWLPSNLSPDKI